MRRVDWRAVAPGRRRPTTGGGITIEEHDASLPLTGERTAPGVWHEGYWYARHVAAYRHLAPRCVGQDVLEAGSGEGYGTDVVRRAGARTVLGLDYDAAAVLHARDRYSPNAFVRANLVQLPLAASSVDVVLSLQVVEHIWTPHDLLAEVARVLRPGGLLAMTTPNRLTFSPGLGRGERPTNPFHARELDADELASLVAAHLDVDDVLGVHAGPRLLRLGHDALVRAQLASPPQRWDPALAAAVRATTPDDFVVVPDDERGVDDALDLLVLARRP